ncbi:RNA polymerase sigma factor [Dapis sp. BLCC M172]|uniref:RNA polymerase sigma factor n=1 Tax=Dapis sp. BLCC M172 TaxID=2975281 RepID=UPI003CF720C5
MENFFGLAINDLPKRVRETFVLYFEKQYCYQEIATELNISYDNVRKRISQARAILRKRYEKYNQVSRGEWLFARTVESSPPPELATEIVAPEISQEVVLSEEKSEAILVGVSELVYETNVNYLGVRSQESGVRRKERRRKNSRGRKFFVCAFIQTINHTVFHQRLLVEVNVDEKLPEIETFRNGEQQFLGVSVLVKLLRKTRQKQKDHFSYQLSKDFSQPLKLVNNSPPEYFGLKIINHLIIRACSGLLRPECCDSRGGFPLKLIT